MGETEADWLPGPTHISSAAFFSVLVARASNPHIRTPLVSTGFQGRPSRKWKPLHMPDWAGCPRSAPAVLGLRNPLWEESLPTRVSHFTRCGVGFARPAGPAGGDRGGSGRVNIPGWPGTVCGKQATGRGLETFLWRFSLHLADSLRHGCDSDYLY